jgi:hypothetical protein
MESLYIYYRVRPECTQRARELIVAIQARATENTAVCARLLRKLESADTESETWMEVYQNAAADFENVLDAMIRDAQFLQLIEAGRHVERFVEQDAAPGQNPCTRTG